eukprot:12464834-Ditylum_brightwellii.AAC.1
MSGHLSKAMRQPATIAQYAAHAGHVFASHLVSLATASCNLRLAAPKQSSQSYYETASTPADPANPCM